MPIAAPACAMGEMLAVLGDYGQSTYGLLARAAFEMGMNHPWHGVGLENFELLCPELTYQGVAFRGMHPHNYYMEWFAETGLPFSLQIVGRLFDDATVLRAGDAYEKATPWRDKRPILAAMETA